MIFILKALITLITFDSIARGNHPKEHFKINDPPCFFNPLCTCSKAFPDLGRVSCKGIPMITIPQELSTSKIFKLHLENNGLRFLQPNFFRFTGIFRIEISQNFLTDIEEETFAGLESTLWELNLQKNKLKEVPNQSFRLLKKLKFLDLSGNEITNVKADDWLGFGHTLKTLILKGNKLSTLGPRTFSKLEQLESLDLSGNSLFEFDVSTFKDGPVMLKRLYLADNLLTVIPLLELSELRNLRHLDLSFNEITAVQDLSNERTKTTTVNFLLDTLHLDYNQIQNLSADSFKSFSELNRTYLTGNPITDIEKNAFRFSKIREIHLKDCRISEVMTEAFFGLEKYLEVLDLEGNYLKTLPLNFFKEFTSLKYLNLKNNMFDDSEDLFGEASLEHLDITDYQNAVFKLHLNKLPDLRFLAFSRISPPNIFSDDLQNYPIQLEELKISLSDIKVLKNNGFKNIRGLRRLDLRENSISAIEDDSFSEIGPSLVYLNLAKGLSSSLTQLPPRAFEDLTSVEHLDLSNNNLNILSAKLFHSMKRLVAIYLQDNFIEFIPKNTFQGDIHLELNSVQLSFNQLTHLESQSFAGLVELEYLWLNDNKISKIEKRAFVNLPNLKYLYLEGNKLVELKEESFQDLPQLELLDLSYNMINGFDFNCFDQVGSLSAFSLNLSHNGLQKLKTNVSDVNDFEVVQISLRALDLSHNNISFIEPNFFKPIESAVTQLYLSHNKLSNITRNVFGNMIHLQWLDVSNNKLSELEEDSFANTKNIQVLDLSENHLQEIPKNFLKDFQRLRIVDLSSNELLSLPVNLFSNGKIEKLDVSKNQLSRVPISSFDAVSASFLIELNLSENSIMTLPSPDVFAVFKNLYRVDLSKNRLIRIEEGTFSNLHHLKLIDLSHNTDLTLDSKGLTFRGLENVLEDLILKNLSLNAIPALPFTSLKFLDLSGNNIFSVPFEFFHNFSQLEKIDFSDNELFNIPPGLTALTNLQYLGVAKNPLKAINFQQNFVLRDLDLRNTSLNVIEKGALGKLPLLKSVKLTLDDNIKNINLPSLLKNNYGLTQLYVEVAGKGNLSEDIFKGSFPPKLQNLTLVGHDLKTLPRNLLQGVRSPHLDLIIFNTSVQEIPKDVFENAEGIRNLSLIVKSNKLKTMSNPNTGDFPNISKKTFLLNLKISDNDWNCDCSLGWIEFWQRKKRQYLCAGNADDCFSVSEDIRTAICSDRKPNTLIEVFKKDLECGWNKSENFKPSVLLIFVTVATLLCYY